MERELDCQGLACPEPVVRTRALVQAEHPASLRVLVDNAAAAENVSRFLARSGYAPGVSQQHDALWVVAATADGTAPADAGPCACQVTEALPGNGRTLVLITTETLGRGDEELGMKLMENFLSSLRELGDNLWRVVLLNGGVKHAARDGKALEALQALERAGVSIYVCGTCLSHYGLLEHKRVGETTNMLDIVTSLDLAGKVIRP